MNFSVNPAEGGDVEVVVCIPVADAPCPAPDVEITGEDCNVLLVTVEGRTTPLSVPLPTSVDPDTARVRWRGKTGRLTFTASPAAKAAATLASCTVALGTAALSGKPSSLGFGDASPAAVSNSCEAAARSTAPPPPDASPPATAARASPCTSCTLPSTSSQIAAVEASTRAAPKAPAVASPAAPATAAQPASQPELEQAGVSPTASKPSQPSNAGVSAASATGAAASSSPARAAAATLTSGAAAAAATAVDDAALYADFYCNSPPAVPPASRPLHDVSPPAAGAVSSSSTAAPDSPIHSSDSCQSGIGSSSNGHGASSSRNNSNGGGGVGVRGDARVNAAKVAAAFEPTGGTASRDAGFSFTAPDLPPPPPLPAGLPPVAPAIDCRYLAIANGLRITAHAQTAAMAELLGLRKAPSGAAAARQRARCGSLLDQVAGSLDAYGYAVLDNYISEDAIRAARKELEVMHEHYSPGLIWVGKEAEAGAQISVNAVRGDVVLWLDDQALGATAFVKDGVRRPCGFLQLQQLLADVDELVFEGLRPRLAYLAGLHRRSDAMMAIYPGKGARFAKHIDNTTMDGRRLTVLTYLNPGWKEEQGGALRLFPVRQGAAEQVDVLPVAGRVAVFLSAEVAHEVMPTHGAVQRHAVTLWYFDAGEHAAALAAARVMPGATSKPSAQAGATALLRDLLAEEAASGIPETKDGCAALGTRVARLEAGAQQLLAAVLGLPSAAALVESFRGLTPSALRQRREELRNMGLNQQHHAPDTSSHITHAR